jgi:hypothetical protein
MVKFRVNNPVNALQRRMAYNNWTIDLTSKGYATGPWTAPCVRVGGFVTPDRAPHTCTTSAFPFFASGEAKYKSNVAVLGKIQDARVQPETFGISKKRSLNQFVKVFFQTEQEIGPGGAVILERPPGFIFTEPCIAKDVEADYYALKAGVDATLRLPNIVIDEFTGASCSLVSQNRALVRLQNIMEGNRKFAYQIQIRNADKWETSQQFGWKIFTADASDYLVDGTPEGVRFVGGNFTESWGLYDKAAGDVRTMNITLDVSDMRPFIMTNNPAWVTIVMRQVQDAPEVDGKLRVIAPVGFKWAFTKGSDEFADLPASLATELTEHLVVEEVTDQFPPGEPEIVDDRFLIFKYAVYKQNKIFGFKMMIRVPDSSPTDSSNSFFLEIGYDKKHTADREVAATLEAPLVQSLSNAVIDYSTNVEGKENSLLFQIQTVSALQ